MEEEIFKLILFIFSVGFLFVCYLLLSSAKRHHAMSGECLEEWGYLLCGAFALIFTVTILWILLKIPVKDEEATNPGHSATESTISAEELGALL